MKTKFKKLTTLLLCGVLSSSMVACVGGTSSNAPVIGGTNSGEGNKG